VAEPFQPFGKRGNKSIVNPVELQAQAAAIQKVWICNCVIWDPQMASLDARVPFVQITLPSPFAILKTTATAPWAA